MRAFIIFPLLVPMASPWTVSQQLPSKTRTARQLLFPITNTALNMTTSEGASDIEGVHNQATTSTPTINRNKSNKKSEEDPPAYLALQGIKLHRKYKQKRRKMRGRRPNYFWANINNIESELRTFWKSVNVPIYKDTPPPIPSEALLNHFERYDIKYGIAYFGGRNVVAETLGGARLISGKWSEACETNEVQCLLNNPDESGLTIDYPPIAPQGKKYLFEKEDIDFEEDSNDHNAIDSLRFQSGVRWHHRSNRRPSGYWDENVVLKELYEFLSYVKDEEGRPSVWMARPSEIGKRGRNDLKQAIARFGGKDHICKLAGLVPYHEWRYFEFSLDLLIELQAYFVMYEDGKEDFFPRLSDIQNRGHDRLYDLIMEFGGRKMVATRLNIMHQANTKDIIFKDMSFGIFSLDFAIRLMHYIRKEMLTLEAPLKIPSLLMPTTKELISNGESQLAEDVAKFGGHENIARRLNLRFDPKEAKRDATSQAIAELSQKADMDKYLSKEMQMVKRKLKTRDGI